SADARRDPLFPPQLSAERARLERLARLAAAREEPCRSSAGAIDYGGLRPTGRRRTRLRRQAARGGRRSRIPRLRRYGARLPALWRRARYRECRGSGLLRGVTPGVRKGACMKSDLKTRHGGRILAEALAAQG